MAKRQEVRERDIQGLKYLEVLLPLIERLHEVGCQHNKAGNRKLHYDEYCLLVLLFLFNPVVRSLRRPATGQPTEKSPEETGLPTNFFGFALGGDRCF